jgi:hypothetical protein
MKKHLLSIILLAASLGSIHRQAAAEPVVLTGSTYTFFLQGSESGNPFLGQTVFDAVAATAERGGATITLSESETVLDTARSKIQLKVASDAELFPVNGETAGLAIGLDGDGLDLLLDVMLDEVRITFFDTTGRVLLISDDLAGEVEDRDRWSGLFPAIGAAIGLDSIGGIGATMVTVDFYVTNIASGDVPEPGTVLLGFAGITAAFAARRRQRQNHN